ncbi:MAG: DUF354 domain-containing protein [Candidatus Methanofastidiosia archaeon]
MKIWIDISNAPHVHFFKRIIRELEKRHEVLVTARRFDSLQEILSLNHIEFKTVGKHGGSTDKGKLLASAERVRELGELISAEKVELTLYKHSVEAARVSFGLKIPSICVLDNENAQAQNKLMLPLSQKVIAPSCIPTSEILRFGVLRENLVRFRGFCEISHIQDFRPNPKVLKELGLDRERKLVVLRPEPSKANYFNGNRKKTIVAKLLRESQDEDLQFVVFPRFEEQREVLNFKNTVIPEVAIDSLSLMSFADLVVSAGGSMNREAIALKTPAISTYPLKLLGVTKHLIHLGVKWHSLSISEIVKYFKTIEKDEDYKRKVTKILSEMENPQDVVLREVERVLEDTLK